MYVNWREQDRLYSASFLLHCFAWNFEIEIDLKMLIEFKNLKAFFFVYIIQPVNKKKKLAKRHKVKIKHWNIQSKTHYHFIQTKQSL